MWGRRVNNWLSVSILWVCNRERCTVLHHHYIMGSSSRYPHRLQFHHYRGYSPHLQWVSAPLAQGSWQRNQFTAVREDEHTYTHSLTHTRTHARTHARTHTHTHTHTHTRTLDRGIFAVSGLSTFCLRGTRYRGVEEVAGLRAAYPLIRTGGRKEGERE